MTNKSMITRLNKSLAVLAKERDRLRDLISDIDGALEVTDRAHDALEESISALSEIV
jgi:hypothetical protein